MVLNGVLDSVGSGLAPAAPALAPAICKCLDSGNPSVRQVGRGCWAAGLGQLRQLGFCRPACQAVARLRMALAACLQQTVPMPWLLLT